MPTLREIRLPVVPPAIGTNGLCSAVAPLNVLVTDHYQCNVCQENCANDPYVVPKCLHSYCGDCISECLRMFGNECPACLVNGTNKRDLLQDNVSAHNGFHTYTTTTIFIIPNYLNQSLQQTKTVIEGVESESSLESTIHEEASPAQVAQTATSSTSVNTTMLAGVLCIDQTSRTMQTLNVKDENAQAQTKSNKTSADRNGVLEDKDDDSNGKEQRLAISPAIAKARDETRAKTRPPKTNKRDRTSDANEDMNEDSLITFDVEGVNTVVDNYKDKERKEKRFAFDSHYNKLAEFKKKFGHCNVPQRFAENPGLGQWCRNIRYAYNQMRKGKKVSRDLSGDRIERLVKIGFKWKDPSRNTMFDKRFDELTDFKNKFGHCYVPKTHAENPALWQWCRNMRYAYNQLQKGQKPSIDLSAERIERLHQIGFKKNPKLRKIQVNAASTSYNQGVINPVTIAKLD